MDKLAKAIDWERLDRHFFGINTCIEQDAINGQRVLRSSRMRVLRSALRQNRLSPKRNLGDFHNSLVADIHGVHAAQGNGQDRPKEILG